VSILEGCRVLDLTRVLTGPYCSMILGDLGADVIKIEMPGRGDDTRGWGPPYLGGESYYFLSVNRSKRSLTLNLKHPEGKEVLRRLIAGSDVLLENFRPGTLERMGFGYRQAAGINPRLVYCSISGYGGTGPESQRPGYDFILQGEAGMMSLTGEEGRPPVRIGVPLVDLGAGMWAAIAILGGLLERQTGGRGKRIDTSLMEAAVAFNSYVASLYFATGENPPKAGAGHLSLVPYQAFPTATQHIIVCVGNDAMWERFCAALGLDIAHDPRFRTNPDRHTNRSELVPLLEERLSREPADVWLRALAEQGVPAGLVRKLDQVFADEQVRARNMVWEMDHPSAGRIRTLGFPIKFDGGPGDGAGAKPPPTLGQHSDEVLLELGYSESDIKAFREDGVI